MPALARLLVALLVSVPQVAAPCDEAFIDEDGDEWDLDSLAGIRTASGPGAMGTWTYKFDICANISPNPQQCVVEGILGTCAARYTLSGPGATCEQLGPDYNIDPDQVTVAKVTVGIADGVSLKWGSTESGIRSFELKIICGTLSTVGTASGTTTAPIVEWTNPSVCDGPIESPSPSPGGGGGGGDGLEWGALTLIALSVSGVLYVGGGTYKNQREGLSGKEALPNLEFWATVPGLFADGVYFSRIKAGGAHPSLGFLTPSGDGPGGGGGGGSYEAVDEEAGGGGRKSAGDSEKSGLISAGDGTDADPPVLLPGGSKSGGVKKTKASGKAGAAAAARAKAKGKAAAKAKKSKPKPKPPPEKGRKPAGSALE